MDIERYEHLVTRHHDALSLTVPQAIPLELLEQVRLRDQLIRKLRTFLLRSDIGISEQVSDALRERWEKERANLLRNATEILEGAG